MDNNLNELQSYHLDTIAEALRAYMRSEANKVYTDDPAWRHEHGLNSRRANDVLEIINPKRAH